jgi:hypothetical protein
MKNLKSLKVVASILVVFAICAAPAFAAELTAGKLMMEIAKVKNLPALNAATAKGSLIEAGINVSKIDVNKVLTQGDVVAISVASGLRMTTSTPGATFSREQMNNFIGSFATQMGNSGTEARSADKENDKPKVDPREKGKGKKKGLYRSPDEPI